MGEVVINIFPHFFHKIFYRKDGEENMKEKRKGDSG